VSGAGGDRGRAAGDARGLNAAEGRDLAVLALGRSQSQRDYVRDVLVNIAERARTPVEQIGFGLELAMGVIRHRLTLARLVRSLLTGKWDDLPADVRHILLVGAYQLIWLETIPDYAIIDEAPNQARRAGQQRFVKLVNAILRNVQRLLKERVDWTKDLPATKTLRYEYGRAWLLEKDFFADPAQDLVTYLSIATSMPTEIISRWINAHGRQQAVEACWASQWRPAAVLRPNRLKTDGPGLLAALTEEGVAAEYDAASESVFVAHMGTVTHSKAFREGLCQVQDVTAQQAVKAAQIKPGMTVLDLAAGVGTKATQAAEVMKNRGRVIAHDIEESRLEKVAANCQRLGITIVETVKPADLEAVLEEIERIDVIFVDAPCSNTGVLSRRPEAKYRLTPKSLESLHRQQVEIVERAVSLAAGRTRLVYSTCSIEPEENEMVIQEVGRNHPDWVVSDSQLFLPSYRGRPSTWRDGGFLAVLDGVAVGG